MFWGHSLICWVLTCVPRPLILQSFLPGYMVLFASRCVAARLLYFTILFTQKHAISSVWIFFWVREYVLIFIVRLCSNTGILYTVSMFSGCALEGQFLSPEEISKAYNVINIHRLRPIPIHNCRYESLQTHHNHAHAYITQILNMGAYIGQIL